jgi:orotate phosphoribosyltransferase
MLSEKRILDHLEQEGAVLTGRHFIYTSGLHGTAYINMRAIAHQALWLASVGGDMAQVIGYDEVDLVLGPETLGRTLAQFTAAGIKGHCGIWCDMVEKDGIKLASFSPKLGFDRLVAGKRVAIVDDLLTTGSSIKLAADLVVECGGTPVMAVAVVRRTPDVTADDCGVFGLHVLADIPGFTTFSPEECADHGPCSQKVPVVLRPGHGWKWIEDHPDYPTA